MELLKKYEIKENEIFLYGENGLRIKCDIIKTKDGRKFVDCNGTNLDTGEKFTVLHEIICWIMDKEKESRSWKSYIGNTFE